MLQHPPSMPFLPPRTALVAAQARATCGLWIAAVLGVAATGCGSAGSDPAALPAAGAGGSANPTTPMGGASNAGGGSGSVAAGTGGVGGNGGAGGSTDGEPASGVGPCNVAVVSSPPPSAFHVTQCTDVEYSTNPPSGGDHYATWAAFQSYEYVVPVGYVVHDLEHGAVAFWYNCPEGCADEVAEVQALIDSQPTDPLCEGLGAARRAVLVPNPDLDSRWALSAWGFALTADCVDTSEFGSFYTAHYGQGPEALCNAGPVIGENACP